MIQFREDLSAPGLWLSVKDYFCRQVTDPRSGNGNTEIPVPSALLSACAMFALKYPSLLQFDQGRVDPTIAHNLKHLFFASHTPSDTHMREIIDKVDPEEVAGALDLVFAKAQRGKCLEKYSFLDGGYLLSLVFARRSGSSRTKKVLPLGAESILKSDGASKNDCEQAASLRLLKNIRNNHPRLKLTVLADGLHSKGPFIKTVRSLNMDFIITAKESDHLALFQQIRMHDRMNTMEFYRLDEPQFRHQFRFKNDLWLNGTSDQKVNVLEYWEHSTTGKTQHWAWVTSIEITSENIMSIMRGARARWKIENETFNTLKNQGYHFEHITDLMFNSWHDFFHKLIYKKTILYDSS